MGKIYSGKNFKIFVFGVLLTVFFSVSCSGCATAKKAVPGGLNSDLFVDPSKRLGERVVVRGVLHWRFEDRSLYPSEREAKFDRRCLPILIKGKHKKLIENAKERDGATVEVTGILVNAARPGMVSVTTCRQVGIEIDSIK